MEWFVSQMEWLATESAGHYLWGAYSRLLGGVYAISLLALVPQLVPLAGKRGMSPVSYTFDAAWRTYGLSALWWFPSVFWLSTHDLMLVAVPAIGGLSGLTVCLLGGPWSPICLFISWVCLLSIDNGPSGLIYPWDSVLLESGFLALFLPASIGSQLVGKEAGVHSFLHGVQSTGLPSALLGFAHRWLLFRLVLGFGKLKFMGSTWDDRFYIKSFIITQPMPSPIGYWAYKLLPDAAWIFLLAGMFVVEMVSPWFLLAPWPMARVLAVLSIQGLMVGIQAGGNFGYFNVLTATLAVPCLYTGPGSSLSWQITDAFPLARTDGGVQTLVQLCADYPAQALFLAIALVLTIPGGCIQLIMNSWVNLSWYYWPNIRRVRSSNALVDTLLIAPGRAYSALLRCVGQFRIVQAYGVFPPSMGPGQRWSCVYEVSADGRSWTRLEYARQHSSVYTPPCFVAPYHPRIDHAVFYESLCMNGQNFTSFLANAHPFTAAPGSTNWQRLQVRLAEATAGPRFPGAVQADIAPNGWIATLLGWCGIGHVASSHPVLWFFQNTASVPLPALSQFKHVRMLACHYLPVQGAPQVDPSTGRTQYWTEQTMDMHLEPYTADSIGSSSERIIKAGLPLGPYDTWPENMHWLWRAVHHSWPLAGESTVKLTPDQRSHLQQFRACLLRAVEAAGHAARPDERTRAGQPASKQAAASASKARRGSQGTKSSLLASGTKQGSASASSSQRKTCAESTQQTFVCVPANLRPADMSSLTPAPLKDLSWECLPAVYDSLHNRLGEQGLATAREALGRLTVPLMLALDVLFGSLPLTVEQRREAVLAWQGKMDAQGQRFVDEYIVMLEGVPEDTSLTISRAQGLPSSTADGLPVHYYAGNDDASPAGCMRNPLRWSFFLHAVFVQQDTEGLSRRLALLERAVCSSDDPMFPVRLQAANRYALWQAIVEPPSRDMVGLLPVHPSSVATEGGSSLLFLFHASVARAWAAGHARLLAQTAPGKTRQTVAALPHFLPGTIDMISRIAAYPGLAALGRPSHRPLPSLTSWSFSTETGQWTYEATHGE